MSDALLKLRNITVAFKMDAGYQPAVDGVSYEVYPGEVLGIVGESGCGKSVHTKAAVGLLSSPLARISEGSAHFEGADLMSMPERSLRRYRGRRIGFVFQEPTPSLDPLISVKDQIHEAIQAHNSTMTRRQIDARVVELLERVGIRGHQGDQAFPHQYSGGMAQRATIACAIANNPSLLIADEPTTALDVTTQAGIIELLRELRRDTQMAVILITHDLGVIAEIADRVVVMYAGRVVESAKVGDLFTRPLHPYTRALLEATPTLEGAGELRTIPGQPPALGEGNTGCAFRPRCPVGSDDPCETVDPPLREVGGNREVACHFHAMA